jgi:ATP-dependent RNA helicase DeaD
MINDAERLPEALYHNICEFGFDKLTDVQKAIIEADAFGSDLFVVAPTGAGKTIGFGLAIATIFGGQHASAAETECRAAVILPTRELAGQVAGVLEKLYRGTGIRITCCSGGEPIEVQSRLLKAGCDIVIATPGRLRMQVQREAIRLGGCRCLVLDEADELLSGDFDHDLEPILREASSGDCRVHLFSATRTAGLERFSQHHQQVPRRIEIRDAALRLPQVDIEAVLVPPVERDQTIARLLRLFHPARSLVFCRRRDDAIRLGGKLHRRGFAVVSLAGSLLPHQRLHATESLSQGMARVCVATDLAARGLDIVGLDLVLHAGLPDSANAMLHRSGRAGRGERRGKAILVLTKPERRRAERLAGQFGRSIDWIAPPRPFTIREADFERIGTDPVFCEDPRDFDRSLADQLRARFSSDIISFACARLWREAQPLAQDLQSERDAPSGPTGADDPQVWLEIDIGTRTRREMTEILMLICTSGRLGKFEVGRIHVCTGTARFEVSNDAVERVLSAAAAGGGPSIRRLADGS